MRLPAGCWQQPAVAATSYSISISDSDNRSEDPQGLVLTNVLLRVNNEPPENETRTVPLYHSFTASFGTVFFFILLKKINKLFQYHFERSLCAPHLLFRIFMLPRRADSADSDSAAESQSVTQAACVQHFSRAV